MVSVRGGPFMLQLLVVAPPLVLEYTRSKVGSTFTFKWNYRRVYQDTLWPEPLPLVTQ